MKRSMTRFAAVALLSVGFAACAAQPSREAARLPGTEACFRAATVFNWVVLDNQTMIVNAPTDQRPYLVKLLGPLPGLKGHERLGFDAGRGRSGMFCGGTATIIVFGTIRRREAVSAVRELTPQEAKRLLAAAGSPVVHREPSTH